jgi:FSR family fosmidomycin resistance protein-like MFS transporter
MTTSNHITASHQPYSPATGPASTGSEFDTGSVTGLGLAHALNDTYASFLPPLLPALMDKLSMSKTQAGLIAFLSTSPSLLQPVVGYLADRTSLRYVVILGPALVSTAMSLLGMAPNLVVLALLITLAGLGSATFHAVAPAMAGYLSGRSLGRGMGIWMVGGALGFAVGPLIVVLALKYLSLEGTAWLMIGGWGASAALFVYLRKVPTQPTNVAYSGSWRSALRPMKPILVPIAGITLLRAFVVIATFTFLPTYLTERGAALWFAGLSVSINAASGMLGSLVGGWMSDRWGRRRVLAAFIFVVPILAVALLAARGWALLPVLILLGFAIPPSNVVVLALVQESSPDARAFASGIYHAIGFSSESIASLAVGFLGDLVGLGSTIAASAGIMLLSLPLVLLLPKTADFSTPGESTPQEPPPARYAYDWDDHD